MEISLEDHLIPRELWGAYGISTNPNHKKKSKKDSVNFSADFDELVSDEIEQLPSPVEDEITEEEEEEEEDLEQDISVVIEEADTVGGEARNETNEGQKVYWKGMEFVEEEDEYAGKDLVILKAKSGEDQAQYLSFLSSPSLDLCPCLSVSWPFPLGSRSCALYFHGLSG
jgi:hypothetical protein